MQKRISFIVGLACVIARLADGQGMLIAQHSGDTDPTTEGFTLSLNGGSGGTVEPVVGDLGLNAWNTTSSGQFAGYYETFTQQKTAELTGKSWVLTLALRNLGVHTEGYSTVFFGTGRMEFYLYFSNESDGDPSVQINSQQYVLQGAGSTYNTYQVVYNNATETADFWVDGQDVIHDVTPDQYSGSANLSWGSGVQIPAEANWNLVSLSVVPEPSAVSLLLFGSGAFLYFAKFRRD
jgi:hypothetical protein